MAAAVKVQVKVRGYGFATKNASPGIKNTSFNLSESHTELCKNCLWEGGTERVHAAQGQGPLEVLQQGQDALLLALPELWASAIPDVLCIL